MNLSQNIIDGAVFCVLVAGFVFVLIVGVMHFVRYFNAATLHTQVISPVPHVECLIVSATDSTSVDCWSVEPANKGE